MLLNTFCFLKDINPGRFFVCFKSPFFVDIEYYSVLFFTAFFSNLYIFATLCRRPLRFQTINSVRSN